MIPTFACVLKSGGDYFPEHVQALAEQVKRYTSIDYRFVCYSDVKIEGVETIPLLENYPGWWSVPEVFRQKGPTVITGIDTVIRDSLDPLFELALKSFNDDFWMIRAFNPKNTFASGIMVYNGDWSGIWNDFTYPESTDGLRGGEQDHTIRYLRRKGVIPKIIQNEISGIYSYKRHCRKNIPSGSRVILFHGKPRPFEVPSIWNQIIGLPENEIGIPELWPDSTVYILGGGPGLLKSNLDLVKDKHVLGVNQAYTLGDFVDVCYSGDGRWYAWNKKRLRKYDGIMVTSYPTYQPDKNKNAKEILNIGRMSGHGISGRTNKSIMWNGNSGASAVNVAYWLGARRVVLLGFDMKRQGKDFNWHSDYPTTPGKKENGRFKSPYRQFLRCWDKIAIDAKELGIEIINCTPGGNLNIFKRESLEDMV